MKVSEITFNQVNRLIESFTVEKESILKEMSGYELRLKNLKEMLDSADNKIQALTKDLESFNER